MYTYMFINIAMQLRPEFTEIVSTVEKLTTMFIHEGKNSL